MRTESQLPGKIGCKTAAGHRKLALFIVKMLPGYRKLANMDIEMPFFIDQVPDNDVIMANMDVKVADVDIKLATFDIIMATMVIRMEKMVR